MLASDEWVLVKVNHAIIHNQRVKYLHLKIILSKNIKLSNSQTMVDHWCETSLLPQAVLKHVVSRDFIVKKFSWDQLCQSRIGHFWITLWARFIFLAIILYAHCVLKSSMRTSNLIDTINYCYESLYTCMCLVADNCTLPFPTG